MAKNTTRTPAKRTYKVKTTDDLRDVFAGNHSRVTSTVDPTPADRALAFQAGFKLNTTPDKTGWTATRR